MGAGLGNRRDQPRDAWLARILHRVVPDRGAPTLPAHRPPSDAVTIQVADADAGAKGETESLAQQADRQRARAARAKRSCVTSGPARRPNALGVDFVSEPFAGGLAGNAERDPNLSPRPAIGTRERYELANASLPNPHAVNRFGDRAQVGRVVHWDRRWGRSPQRVSPPAGFPLRCAWCPLWSSVWQVLGAAGHGVGDHGVIAVDAEHADFEQIADASGTDAHREVVILKAAIGRWRYGRHEACLRQRFRACGLILRSAH